MPPGAVHCLDHSAAAFVPCPTCAAAPGPLQGLPHHPPRTPAGRRPRPLAERPVFTSAALTPSSQIWALQTQILDERIPRSTQLFRDLFSCPPQLLVSSLASPISIVRPSFSDGLGVCTCTRFSLIRQLLAPHRLDIKAVNQVINSTFCYKPGYLLGTAAHMPLHCCIPLHHNLHLAT